MVEISLQFLESCVCCQEDLEVDCFIGLNFRAVLATDTYIHVYTSKYLHLYLVYGYLT